MSTILSSGAHVDLGQAELPRDQVISIARELVQAVRTMRQTLRDCGMGSADFGDLFCLVDRKSEQLVMHAYALNGSCTPLGDKDTPGFLGDVQQGILKLTARLGEQEAIAAWELPAMSERAFGPLRRVLRRSFAEAASLI